MRSSPGPRSPRSTTLPNAAAAGLPSVVKLDFNAPMKDPAGRDDAGEVAKLRFLYYEVSQCVWFVNLLLVSAILFDLADLVFILFSKNRSMSSKRRCVIGRSL